VTDDLGFRFTWYGHATVHVESRAGTSILFDPWFGNPRSPATVERIERCDVLLVTHGHHDHLGALPGQIRDADALTIARRTHPAWPAIHELALWLDSFGDLGAEVVAMNKGGSVEVRGVRVSMVHADHSAGDFDAGLGVPVYLGEPAGFVVELENGRRLYHAGDTALFGTCVSSRALPPGRRLPVHRGALHDGSVAAARAVELLGVSTVVPSTTARSPSWPAPRTSCAASWPTWTWATWSCSPRAGATVG